MTDLGFTAVPRTAYPTRAKRRAVPAFKRPFDIALTLAILLLAAPLMLAIALLVRLSGPGPVFFRQTRVGLGGAPFRMLKFRSMHADAEARLAELRALSERDGPCFKIANDPRVTPVGRVLRRFSLDELPQLLNVLKGDMSLVGPRPGLPSEVAQYGLRDRGRLDALPGITGAWQVGGRADIPFAQMVEMDLDYIATCSAAGDLRILLRTFRAVLDGRGAY